MPPTQSLNSFLHALENVVKEQQKHTLLLVRPSYEEYTQTLESIYSHLQLEPPADLLQSQLNRGVLNYTYIRNDEQGDPIGGYIEIYTVYDPSLEDLSLTENLISILKNASSNVDVLVFINSLKDSLAQTVNSVIDEDLLTEEKIRKTILIPLLHRMLDPFFDLTDNDYHWKSCSILLSSVSRLIYKAMTIPIIDFIQQFLRSLLHHFYSDSDKSRTGFLIYFPLEITVNKEKTKRLWTHLLPLDKALVSSQPLLDKTSSETPIKYSDVFIESQNDTFRNIDLLDDSFDWPQWLAFWNCHPE